MKAPIGWWWLLIAGMAATVAVLGGVGSPVVVPAATVAVVAGAGLVIEIVVRHRSPAEVEGPPPTAGPGGLREAFVGGAPGREDLVLACDLLERRLSRPDLRARTAAEVAAIVGLPPEEFRRYVAARLDALEGAS